MTHDENEYCVDTDCENEYCEHNKDHVDDSDIEEEQATVKMTLTERTGSVKMTLREIQHP